MKGGFILPREKGVETIGVTIRMPLDVVDKLDTLCKIGGMKRSQYIINTIITDYDQVQGNPEAKKLLQTMKELTEKFGQLYNQ